MTREDITENIRISAKESLSQYGWKQPKPLFDEGCLTLRRLMSYIYMEHPFLMFLDHTR